jgi:hypothetical protein
MLRESVATQDHPPTQDRFENAWDCGQDSPVQAASLLDLIMKRWLPGPVPARAKATRESVAFDQAILDQLDRGYAYLALIKTQGAVD